MTSIDPATNPADVAGLPADPTVYRRKGLGLGVWLTLALCALCIVGGVIIGIYGAALFPKKDAVATSQPALPRASDIDPLPLAAPPAADLIGSVDAPGAPADVASLSARVNRLELGQARTAQAASAALATSALIQAVQTSRPFAGELAAVESLLPQAADVAALRRVAQTGAPTRTALAAEFPAAAARAIAAARAPGEDAGLLDRLRHALGSIVTIRRVDYVKGDGPHAVLARAEASVGEGDVEGALAELDALPPAARDALSGWRARAERRAEVDRRVAGIREASLRALQDSLGQDRLGQNSVGAGA
jgi:hypothetical protein